MSKLPALNKEVPLACKLLTEAQLHGVKRLADKKYRLCWAIAMILLMWSSISLVMLLITRYLDHPTTIVRVEKYRTNMSFPSVLIFLELSYHDYKIDALLDKMEFPPTLNRSYIRSVIRQLATFHNPDVIFTISDLENIERVLDYNNLDLREVTESLTTTCEEAILRCRWKGVMTNCSTLFRMELSEFGYCCVFNGRSLKRELASGAAVVATSSHNIYTTNIGPRNGLTFAMNQSLQLSDMDLTYKWLAITNPQRFVDSSNSNGTPISPGKEVWFGYDTVSFHVSENARSLHPGLRRCMLSQTRLQYFPVYHKHYCVLECTMQATLLNCNCVMFTHPARPGVPYCRARSLMCARHIAGTLTADKCGCPMTCDVDKAEMSVSDFMMSPNVTPIDPFYENLDFEKVTVIKVFVERREVYLNNRVAFFTGIDLFAQLGGTFNVFFGCSVLSMLELIQLAWYSFKQWRWKGMNSRKVQAENKEKKNKNKNGRKKQSQMSFFPILKN